MPQVMVPVTWVKQETPYYCGPATAQMTLTTLGVRAPRGAATTWQDKLWKAVERETNARRPRDAGPGTKKIPAFREQRCVKYKGWKCWTTTPGTLRRLLNKRQRRVIFTVRSLPSDLAAAAAIIKALDRNIPSAVLVNGFAHWIVVEGYEHGDTSEPSVNVAGKDVNFVCLRDPDEESIHEIACETLIDNYLKVVPAGKYKNEIVVMGARWRSTKALARKRRRRVGRMKK